MAGMTIHYIRNHHHSIHGRRLSLYYTITMILLTIANYYTSAKVLEALIIEVPANAAEAGDADSCGPVSIVNNIVSILQILLSDGLMVTYILSMRYCHIYSKFCRYIALMFCMMA
jgi:hypothetical protein